MTQPATDQPSFRDRRRDELVARVREVARDHLAAHGVDGLTLRGVAREIGISVSALYRYFRNRDDLLTALLVESFDAQADAVDRAVRTAADGDLTDRIRAAFRAYRSWSVTHPREFALCYGAPVPGYAAPGEQTIRAGTRVSTTLIGLLSEAHAQGRVDSAAVARSADRLDPPTRRQMQAMARRRGYDLELGLLALSIDAMVHLHGFVAMEVFGQLRPIVTEADGYFERTLDAALATIGLGGPESPPSVPRRRPARRAGH